jgi:hypothetical protein
MTLTASIVLLAPVSPVEARWEPVLGRDTMARLAACETGGNLAHFTRTYVSAWGFAKTTWRMFSDTPVHRVKLLSWDQQARVVDRAFWFGHTRNGRKQWPVGPFGHGCFKKFYREDANLRTRICNNRKQQVRRWCRP